MKDIGEFEMPTLWEGHEDGERSEVAAMKQLLFLRYRTIWASSLQFTQMLSGMNFRAKILLLSALLSLFLGVYVLHSRQASATSP